MTKLLGFGFTGYRSFSGELLPIYPLTKVNLFAGQNNTGKSNILRFMSDFLVNPRMLTILDKPVQNSAQPFKMELACKISDRELDNIIDTAKQNASQYERPQLKAALRQLCQLAPLYRNDTDSDVMWIKYELGGGPNDPRWIVDQILLDTLASAVDQEGNQYVVSDLSQYLTKSVGANLQVSIANLLGHLSPLRKLPEATSIDAFRKISPSSGSKTLADQFNGLGLTARLQELERPDMGNLHLKEKFAAINSFVQHVLEDGTAQIEIPGKANTIHVIKSGKTLPLENLGTGIHQVVILASAATLLDEKIVCMEEPEVHIHPLLQKKLIQYLQTRTSNQYLIATHSSHILDHERSSVFHVQLSDEGTSKVRRAASPHLVSSICSDLGYRASDLLQSNAVIWVEGPSDRIYLRHWLSLIDPKLIEGVHYSVMFYGGGLLRHLSAHDQEIDDFISLRKLNRNVGILIDSDKKTAQTRINATKKRVITTFEAEDSPGFAWVTNCRTIENYVPPAILKQAVKQTHPKSTHTYDDSENKWADPLNIAATWTPNKVRIAHLACENWKADELKRWELITQIKTCAQFIRNANGMDL